MVFAGRPSSQRNLFGTAKEMIDPTIYRLVCQDIGGDHQRVHNRNTRYSAITFKHCLLPVWVAAYRYHDKAFQVLVNGTTGKVVGKRPWSMMKMLVVMGAQNVTQRRTGS